MKSTKIDSFLGLILIIVSIILFLYTTDMPIKVGYFPKLLSISLAFMSVLLILSALRNERNNSYTVSKEKNMNYRWIKVAATVIIITIYAMTLNILGYLFSTFLVNMSLMYILGYRKKFWIIFLSICISLGLYVLFGTVFKVDLPTNKLI